jgi:hypothetical protein
VYRNAVRERFVSSGAESGPALPVQFVVVDDLVFIALFCQQQLLPVQILFKVNFIFIKLVIDKLLQFELRLVTWS